MANFDVSNPVYSNEIRKLETTDPAHADTFNPLFQQLLENDEVINKNLDNVAILDDAGEPLEPEIPTDSDLLGGQPKSYYEGLINAVGNRVTPIETAYSQLANPNILINPNFKINQRGQLSYNIPNIYSVDRWKNFGVNNTITPNSSGINISCTYTNSSNLLRQVIEHPELYAGMALTLSMKYKNLKLGTNNKVIVSFEDGATVFQVDVTSTSGIAKVTGIISSTPSTLAVGCTKIGTGSSFSLDIEWMKLEVGSIATPFIPRLYAEELALCQRYYFDNISRVIMTGALISGTSYLIGNYIYPAPMRAIPTITIYNQDNGNINHIRKTTVGTDIAATSFEANAQWFNNRMFSLLAIIGITPAIEVGVLYDFGVRLDAEIY